jgi:hypothetical protein
MLNWWNLFPIQLFFLSFLVVLIWICLVIFITFNITYFWPWCKFTDYPWFSHKPYLIFFQTKVNFLNTVILKSAIITELDHKSLEFFKLFVVWWFINLFQILVVIGNISWLYWFDAAHYLVLGWFNSIFCLAFISN